MRQMSVELENSNQLLKTSKLKRNPRHGRRKRTKRINILELSYTPKAKVSINMQIMDDPNI